MTLERVMYRRFTAARPNGSLATGRAPGSAARSVGSMIAELEKRFGGVKVAAQAAGIPISTWGHLKRGRKPSKANLERLRSFQHVSRMRNEDAYRTWPGVVLHARVVISKDDRTRGLNIGTWTNDNGRRRLDAVQQRVVDAWQAGDAGLAAALLEGPVEEALGFPPGSFSLYITVYDLRYFPTQGQASDWADTLRTGP